jgi:hypothetical protein
MSTHKKVDYNKTSKRQNVERFILLNRLTVDSVELLALPIVDFSNSAYPTLHVTCFDTTELYVY